jgi:hypothetical protein
VVHAAVASVRESAAVREGAMAFIKEAEDWATQVERGAWESAAFLASTRGEAYEAVHEVTLLKDKLADAH